MKAKDYLSQIKQSDIKIKQLLKELKDLEESQLALSGIDYSKDKIQTSVGDAAYTRLVEKHYDLQLEINATIDNYVSFKHRVIHQIQSLSKTEYIEILYKRYVEYKTFETICTETFLSYYRIIHIHGEALKEFDDKFLKS